MAANDLRIIQENGSSDFVERILSGVASGKVLVINASNIPELRALAVSDIASLQTLLDGKISSTEKGAVNGVATLGASGKVPSEQLDMASVITNKGAWNANTNTPVIPQATSSNNGWRYQVSVAGNTTIDGQTDFEVGDLLISNGTTWDKFDNTDKVNSVAGRTGAVTLTKADVGLPNVIDALQFLASNVDTDISLTANSDTKVASQKAVKTWVTSYSAPIAHNHDANYEPKNTNIQGHISDTTIHVTGTDKTNWNAKASTAVATTTVSGLMAFADKVKLDGIATNANNYTHPANHAASVITQDASNRFVTDTEKTTWNGKLGWSTVPASATSSGTAGQIAYEDDYFYICVATNKWKRFIGVTF